MMPHDVMSHLVHLVDDIGPRAAGTPGNQLAGDYIAAVFRNAGLVVEEQSVDYPNWLPVHTELRIGTEILPVAINPFSPSAIVHGPVVPVVTLADLEHAPLAGCIALLGGELTQKPLLPLNFPLFQDDYARHVHHLLSTRGLLAALTLPPENAFNEPLIQDRDLNLPTATIQPRDALRLLTHTGETAYLTLQSLRVPSSTRNIIGRTPYRNGPHVVLCAHYDSKFGSPGAWDNASGTAVLLTLAQHFADRDLAVEFTAFTDEEYYAACDEAYIQACAHSCDDIIAAINLDGVGLALGAHTVTTLSASTALTTTVQELVEHEPHTTWVEPWYESNHSTFAMRGVPAIAVSSVGPRAMIHLPEDDLRWVSAERLRAAQTLAARLVALVADHKPLWARTNQREDESHPPVGHAAHGAAVLLG